MVWAPLVYGLVAGGVYSWGMGKDRPEQIAKSAALGAAGGAVIAFLITTTRKARAEVPTKSGKMGQLPRRCGARPCG